MLIPVWIKLFFLITTLPLSGFSYFTSRDFDVKSTLKTVKRTPPPVFRKQVSSRQDRGTLAAESGALVNWVGLPEYHVKGDRKQNHNPAKNFCAGRSLHLNDAFTREARTRQKSTGAADPGR